MKIWILLMGVLFAVPAFAETVEFTGGLSFSVCHGTGPTSPCQSESLGTNTISVSLDPSGGDASASYFSGHWNQQFTYHDIALSPSIVVTKTELRDGGVTYVVSLSMGTQDEVVGQTPYFSSIVGSIKGLNTLLFTGKRVTTTSVGHDGSVRTETITPTFALYPKNSARH